VSLSNRGLTGGASLGELAYEPPKAPKRGGRRGASPTVRSLKLLREEGWLADKVEQTIPVPGHNITRDLFGFGDILAVNEGLGVLIVQTTSGDHVAHRAQKIEEECLPAVLRCLRAGVLVHVHGWAKRGLRGEKKLWSCRIVKARLGPDDSVEWTEEREEKV
jgi:hypothetical protein